MYYNMNISRIINKNIEFSKIRNYYFLPQIIRHKSSVSHYRCPQDVEYAEKVQKKKCSEKKNYRKLLKDIQKNEENLIFSYAKWYENSDKPLNRSIRREQIKLFLDQYN